MGGEEVSKGNTLDAALKEQAKKLLDKNAKLTQQTKILTEERDRLQVLLEQKNKSLQDNNEKLCDCATERDELCHRVKDLEKKERQLEIEESDRQSDLLRTRQMLRKSKEEVNELKSLIAAQKEKSSAAKARQEETRLSEITLLQKKNQSLEDQLVKSEKQRKALTDHSNALKQDLLKVSAEMREQKAYYAQTVKNNQVYVQNEVIYKKNEKSYEEEIKHLRATLQMYEEQKVPPQQRSEHATSIEPQLREEIQRIIERNKSLVSERDELSRANGELRTRMISTCLQRDTRGFNNVNDEHRQERAIQEFRALWSNERLGALDVLEDAAVETEVACKLLASVMTVSYSVVAERVDQVLQHCEQCTQNLLLCTASPAPRNSELRSAARSGIKLQFSQLDFNSFYKTMEAAVSKQHCVEARLLQQLDFRNFSLQAIKVACLLVLQSPPLRLENDPNVSYRTDKHQIYADCLHPKGDLKIQFFVWPTLVSDDGEEVYEKGTVYV